MVLLVGGWVGVAMDGWMDGCIWTDRQTDRRDGLCGRCLCRLGLGLGAAVVVVCTYLPTYLPYLPR